MLIVCPSCATSYMVDAGSLGPAGRMVRCARCKTAWFAGGPNTRSEDAAFAENVIAEAEGRPTAPPPPRMPQAAPMETPVAAAPDDFAEEDHSPVVQPITRVQDIPQSIDDPLPPMVSADIAPPLVPPMDNEPPAPPHHAAIDIEDVEGFAARRQRMQTKRKAKRRSSKWAALILVLFGFNVALVGARNEVVRYVPQTASLFAAIGLPVNLRHLTFENVKITKEETDGVNVLVVEGDIVSAAKNAVEVPRMRFAVRNNAGQEIYSWTAQPNRSVLGPGETMQFRSRLASPPAEASDVVVRFFTMRDATPGSK